MSIFYRTVIGLSMATLFTFTANAANSFTCTGKITTLGVHSTDRAFLSLEGMSGPVNICNLGKTIGTVYPVSAEQCKVAYSTLLTAYSMGKSISVHFDNVASADCSSAGNWEVATARWVHLDG
jgi:hypothetical protein